MKALSIAVILAVTGCSSYQPVARTAVARVAKVIVSNPNAQKVVKQLSELHKAKGVHSFVETRRALGGVIGDRAGSELYQTFVQERYQTTILDLYRSYTEDHLQALNRAIDKLGKATSRQKFDSHVREVEGLMKTLSGKVRERDTVFRQVMPYSDRATNIRNSVNELDRRQREEVTPGLQNRLTEAILQTLDSYSKRDQPALLIVGENLRKSLGWIF